MKNISSELVQEVSSTLMAKHDIDIFNFEPEFVSRRLCLRAKLHTESNLQKYVEFLTSNDFESKFLVSDLNWSPVVGTIGSLVYQIRNVILPNILKENLTGEVNLWFYGCGTGDNLYSFVALCHEYFKLREIPPEKLQIFATDLDPSVLKLAQRGFFIRSNPGDNDRHTSDLLRKSDSNIFEAHPKLKKHVNFQRSDGVSSAPETKFDAIIVRKMPRFSQVFQSKLAQSFSKHLSNNGMLVLPDLPNVQNQGFPGTSFQKEGAFENIFSPARKT